MKLGTVRRIVALNLVALGALSPATAATVLATFTGTTGGYYSSGLSESSYTQSQQDFFEGSYGSYSFTFSYDTATPAVQGNTGYYSHAATLVSGSAGSYSNFAGFTASIDQVASQPGQADTMFFRLYREDLYIPDNYSRFTSEVTFVLVDNQGGLYSSPAQLPTSIDQASLEQSTAEMRISRTSGNYIYHNGGALVSTSLASAVPEPASWAMMIGGFGMIGCGARARRRRSVSTA